MGKLGRSLSRNVVTSLVLGGLVTVASCGGSKPQFDDSGDAGADGSVRGAGSVIDDPSGLGNDLGDASTVTQTPDGDPTTCAEAEKAKSYVGCDYWPTVVPNLVKELFDYAVIVSNVGKTTAKVSVAGPGGVSQQVTVQPGELSTIYLPWVPALKGPTTGGLQASAIARQSAYHLVSDRPVIVYQFNALEYKGEGGPPGKDWSNCVDFLEQLSGMSCFSYSNDASLLLPSTAMTGNYRVIGQHGWTRTLPNNATDSTYFAVTATQDGTEVEVTLSATASVLAGGSAIGAAGPGGKVKFSLDHGDVALVTAPQGQEHDLSGSLVAASKPVQVISGVPCIDAPMNQEACDHIEETVFPAETLGKRYVMNVSTGPKGSPIGHIVRFVGNKDGTTLTYVPSRPPSCPATLDAGQVADCGVIKMDFEVSGSHEFAVGSYMLGGEILDPGNLFGPQGDPSMSFAVATEQFQKTYLFLAPHDYESNYVDIVGPPGVSVTLDGAPLSTTFKAVSPEFGVARVKLGAGQNGAHSLSSDSPVGIQVVGYGANTSYQYPGGLNLGQIAPPPIR